MDNILTLHRDLANHTYRQGSYQAFNVSDPKPRNIHKATVRDRLLHHAIHRKLYPFFDRIFIADVFSCRIGKGMHKAIDRFRSFAYVVSKNHTKTCWTLKCDVRRFFASIDHGTLFKILEQYIRDKEILWLIDELIRSFEVKPGTGLPLGNLTSQLLVNVYMNEFDRHMKHTLKVKHYIRYADDVIVLFDNKKWLEELKRPITEFLRNTLKLKLHPDKTRIKTIASGVDYLGWVHFPDHRVLRTATKRRMLKRIAEQHVPETLNSYMGMLSHGNSQKIRKKIATEFPYLMVRT